MCDCFHNKFNQIIIWITFLIMPKYILNGIHENRSTHVGYAQDSNYFHELGE